MSMLQEFPGGFAATLVCGSHTDTVVIDPKTGATADHVSRGYGVTPPAGGNFGTLTPAVYKGFTIKELYQVDSNGTTFLVLLGDATALAPLLRIGGVNQNLGAGSFDGTYTTFSGTATDPFSGTVTVTMP